MRKGKKSKLIGTGAIFGTMAVIGSALAIGKNLERKKYRGF